MFPSKSSWVVKMKENSQNSKRARRHFSQLSEFERGLIIGRKLQAGRRAVLLARWIVRSVPLEIVGSSGHEKVPTRGKLGLKRPGRPQGKRIVRQALVDPTVTHSTIRADVGVAIAPQTISRHLAEANLKFKRPFRARTSATASTVVPSQINVECHRLAKGCVYL
ncbi:transposable element Tc1 transposase [Trichonephila clavipes]|nr:transposable element Tc1 transposase [Trichonephila clavipes]